MIEIWGEDNSRRHALLDQHSRNSLPKLYANEEKGLEAQAPVKFFTPDSNWTWYASEFDGEDIFFGLATQNVEILNKVKPKRIVTTCPHCLHTIKNEYPAFGGNYQVIHHTQLINELVGAGKISMNLEGDNMKVTFHDPCYLGRHNKITDAPRSTLESAGVTTIEMPRNGAKAFCCGAGGAQMWKEEENGTSRVNEARFAEAKSTGADTVAVGCPFCLTMMSDASKADGGNIQVKDVAEIVAERLK